MDVEAMAKAMFDAFHARYNRVRDWSRHAAQDVGAEMGKLTFLHMARAAADAGKAEPVDAEQEADQQAVANVVGPADGANN